MLDKQRYAGLPYLPGKQRSGNISERELLGSVIGEAKTCHRATIDLISTDTTAKTRNCWRYRALPLNEGPVRPDPKGELR